MKKLNINSDWTVWKAEDSGSSPNSIPLNKGTAINLPYDAMIREKRIAKLVGGETSAYYPGGYYVYEKRIDVPEEWCGKHVLLECEGVWQKAKVYLNGEFINSHLNGYTNFFTDLSDHLKCGETNLLTITADNTQTPNSRWYTGSGIYRDVNLYVGNREAFLPQAIRITTKSFDPAVVDIAWKLTDTEGREVVLTVFEKNTGKPVAQKKIDAQSAHTELEIPNAKLWSAENPELYLLRTELLCNGECVDSVEEVFGIRLLSWSGKDGLLLNGQELKLRGACIHHDNGIVGSSEFKKTAYRRIRKLKEIGFNAVRHAHNPISKHLLDACDELGMYVMDEFSDVWRGSKNAYDYALYFDSEWESDIDAMVSHDYNHPCVVMYSTGNEVYDITHKCANDTNRMLADRIRMTDTTRPITNGINVLAANKQDNKPVAKPKTSQEDIVDPNREGKDGPMVGSKLMNAVATLLPKLQQSVTAEKLCGALDEFNGSMDIIGLNYGTHMTTQFAKQYPDKLVVHSETYPSRIGKTWPDTLAAKNVCGDFMWVGWDYLGEAGIGLPYYGNGAFPISKPYPCAVAGSGCINIVGDIEAQGFYAKAVFGMTDTPYIAVHPLTHTKEKCKVGQWRLTDAVNSWSWKGYEKIKTTVDIYSNASEVELINNGKSLGRIKPEHYIATFKKVKYRGGKLEAVAFDCNSKEIGRSCLACAQEDKVLSICAEDTELIANGQDIAFIRISMADKKGTVHILDKSEITVKVEGEGSLEALGSSDPYPLRPYSSNTVELYDGCAYAVIRSGNKEGNITVSVSSEGLGTAVVTLSCN